MDSTNTTNTTEATDAGKATHDLSKNGADCLRAERAQMVQLGELMERLEGLAEEKGMGPAVVVAGMLGAAAGTLVMVLEGLVHEVAALRKALEAGKA